MNGKKVLAILAMFVILLVPIAAPVSASSLKGGGNYYHPEPSNVWVGDIVFGHSSSSDWLIPGYWTHVGIIVGWSSTYNDWIVVEARTDDGVSWTTLRTFLSRYDTVAMGYVPSVSDSIRYAAAQFAINQMGKPYNWDYLSKPNVYDDKYYCSQLVWAAYLAAGGPNLDANPGWSWTYGYAVAPQEIYDDDNVVIYYYDSA